MIVDLTQMREGESGVIAEVQGGEGLIRKVHSMGIRPGKKVTKVSSHFWGGPQVVKVGHCQVAIGFGMAKKIFVKVEDGNR